MKDVLFNKIMKRETELQRAYDNVNDEIREIKAIVITLEYELKRKKIELRAAKKMLTRIKGKAKADGVLYALYI